MSLTLSVNRRSKFLSSLLFFLLFFLLSIFFPGCNCSSRTKNSSTATVPEKTLKVEISREANISCERLIYFLKNTAKPGFASEFSIIASARDPYQPLPSATSESFLLARENEPDIYIVTSYELGALAEAGLITPVDNLEEALEGHPLHPLAGKLVTVSDSPMAYPLGLISSALYIRRDLLSISGIHEASTSMEILSAATHLRNNLNMRSLVPVLWPAGETIEVFSRFLEKLHLTGIHFELTRDCLTRLEMDSIETALSSLKSEIQSGLVPDSVMLETRLSTLNAFCNDRALAILTDTRQFTTYESLTGINHIISGRSNISEASRSVSPAPEDAHYVRGSAGTQSSGTLKRNQLLFVEGLDGSPARVFCVALAVSSSCRNPALARELSLLLRSSRGQEFLWREFNLISPYLIGPSSASQESMALFSSKEKILLSGHPKAMQIIASVTRTVSRVLTGVATPRDGATEIRSVLRSLL